MATVTFYDGTTVKLSLRDALALLATLRREGWVLQ